MNSTKYTLSKNLEHFKLTDVTSKAIKKSCIYFGNARFTVLKERLIRCEYSKEHEYVDSPSQHFWFRKQPYVPFKVRKNGGRIDISTEKLELTYLEAGTGFTAETLFIKVKETGKLWKFGDADPENLGGTTRTLDNCYGDYDVSSFHKLILSTGMLSRSGWAMVDDSRSLIFDADGFLRLRMNQNQDLYFFGYGLDFKGCITDYYSVSGNVRMIPKWSLGIWWSRWQKYKQYDLERIADEFKDHNVPLSVCVVDMDWHLRGWTGYTWNPRYFPSPKGFLERMHKRGIHVCLNLHPAGGIGPHEKMYPQMAKHMGIDPATKEWIEFDLTSERFIDGYFKYMHHPLEKDGVDFWWIDWQQGTKSKLCGLDPLWYLNHLHAKDLARDWKKRPINFSRWGNNGSHRYPIGFSGDTISTWKSLNFQIYFTAVSANVGYSWWSHDIGGFLQLIRNDELYTRWVQFGCFSPIFRFHNSGTPRADNKPWSKEPVYRDAAIEALKLRRSLLPYLYTSAWKNRCGGLPLIRPMYHEHPKEKNAYKCEHQYYFGEDLVVSPYNSKIVSGDKKALKKVWLPGSSEENWYSFFSGKSYKGGRWYDIRGGINHIPVFAKAGSIIPLELEGGGYEILLFEGNGTCQIYDDDGVTLKYKEGKFALYSCKNSWKGGNISFTMKQVKGDLRLNKDIVVVLKSFNGYSRVSVSINERPQTEVARSKNGSFRIEGIKYKGRAIKVNIKAITKI